MLPTQPLTRVRLIWHPKKKSLNCEDLCLPKGLCGSDLEPWSLLLYHHHYYDHAFVFTEHSNDLVFDYFVLQGAQKKENKKKRIYKWTCRKSQWEQISHSVFTHLHSQLWNKTQCALTSGKQNKRSWRTKKHMVAWQTTLVLPQSSVALGISVPSSPSLAGFILYPLSSSTEAMIQSPEPKCLQQLDFSGAVK